MVLSALSIYPVKWHLKPCHINLLTAVLTSTNCTLIFPFTKQKTVPFSFVIFLIVMSFFFMVEGTHHGYVMQILRGGSYVQHLSLAHLRSPRF